MDWGNVLTSIITAVTLLVPAWWKWNHEKKKDKDAATKLASEVKHAADKFAYDTATQIQNDFKKLVEKLEESTNRLVAITEKQFLDKEHREKEEKQRQLEKSSVEYLIKVDREISHKTKRIVFYYQAMRSYVIHFSDGSVTEANLHLLKITFLHESLVDWSEKRVDSVAKLFKETHIPDMFLSPMYRLIKEGEYYLKDVESLDIKNAHARDYYDWLTAYNVKSSLWIPIRTNEGKIVAVLVAHWPVKTDWPGTVLAKIRDVNRLIEQVYDEFKPHEI